MSNYRCPRCKAEVEKTAPDCGACGKPIAPLPWSLRLHDLGKHAPDAQVVDFARAMIPVRMGFLLFIWGTTALAGAGGLWMVEARMDKVHDLRQQVETDVRGDLVPPGVRADAMGLLEIQDGMIKIIKGTLAMVVGLGVLGIGAELGAFKLTRRLLAVGALAPA